MNIVIAIIVLGVLVFVHEFGHFIVAKFFKVYVEKFSIGFGPVLFKKKYGETEYAISALPLGGYVKMYGEQNDDEPGMDSYDPAKEGRSFKDKKGYEKAAIIFAGPLFNIIFAIIIFWALYMTGIPSYSAIIGEVEKDSIAEISGLKSGDKIISVNNEKIVSWSDFATIISESPNKKINIELADNRKIELTVGEKEVEDIFGDKENIGFIGASLHIEAIVGKVSNGMPAKQAGIMKDDKILAINGEKVTSWSQAASVIRSKPEEKLNLLIERNNEQINIEVTPKASENSTKTIGLIGISPIDGDIITRYGPFDALSMGLQKSYELTKIIYLGFVKLIERAIPADSLGGPILIVETAAQSAESGFATLLIFMAAISINLAVFNLLPIPILDGGQLAIILTESIMGRPLGEKALGYFNTFGLLVIISLMVFAFYNDIMRLIR